MAERAYRTLEPLTIERHSDNLRRELVKIGAVDEGDTTRPRFPAMFDVPLHLALSPITSEVLGAFVDLGFDPARVAGLTVGVGAGDALPAGYTGFDDGTGMVLVSDSMIILCSAYCEYAGRTFADTTSRGVLRMFGRLLLTRWTGRLGEDPFRLAGILRYHNVCRRVFGVPGVLTFAERPADDMAAPMRDLFLGFGLRFLIGHEVAHHLIGNDELDADTLGLHAAAEAFRREVAPDMAGLPERWRQEIAEFHGLVGAVITMIALRTCERALLIRPGGTHPPAGRRADLLIEHILSPERQRALDRLVGRTDSRMTMRFEKDRGTLQVYLRNLVTATEQAAAFGPDGPPFDWDALAALPMIEQPRAGHLAEIAQLDRLMCAADTTLAATIGDRLGHDGTRLVIASDVAAGLRAWGVPAARVDAMNAPATALAFHDLAETLTGLAGNRDAGVAAASLAARGLGPAS